PQLCQALDRNRHRRLQLLRKERDAQLLQQPPELLDLLRQRAELGARSKLTPEALLERGHFRSALAIARGVSTHFVQTQSGRAQVSGQMLQTLPGRARKPAGGKQRLALPTNIGRGFWKRFLHGIEPLEDLVVLGQNGRSEALQFLRDEVEAASPLLDAARE